MSFTATEAIRIEAIENMLNDLQTAINALVPKATMKGLLTIRQAEIDDLQDRVAALESQVLVLQG